MKIRDIMTPQAESCGPDADLAAAAMIMWRQDCGVVPIVDEQKRILGVVTDRDICIATATRHLRPEELRVKDVMSRRSITVGPLEDVHAALEAMRNEQVRRLPVVDAERRLLGIISINDLVNAAGPSTKRAGAGVGVSSSDVFGTLKAICAHTVPMRVSERTSEPAHAG